MESLATDILAALADGRYIESVHAAEQLRRRRIPAWQVVPATLDGEVLREDGSARPNPKVEFEILLADGVAAKAVWSWLAQDRAAKLVTIHFFDR